MEEGGRQTDTESNKLGTRQRKRKENLCSNIPNSCQMFRILMCTWQTDNSLTDRQTDIDSRQTCMHTDGWTDRQTDIERQTNRSNNRQERQRKRKENMCSYITPHQIFKMIINIMDSKLNKDITIMDDSTEFPLPSHELSQCLAFKRIVTFLLLTQISQSSKHFLNGIPTIYALKIVVNSIPGLDVILFCMFSSGKYHCQYCHLLSSS